MKTGKAFYGLLSLLTLIIGMVIYLLFRDLNNMILFSWVKKPECFGKILVPLESSIFSNIIRFNIPDMLWFLSAILLFRFLWFYNHKIQKVYILCFYVIGFFFEMSQLLRKIPGTFDWLDLFFMGIGAFVEGLLYKMFTQRRLV